ncbi:MAG TPA: VIT and VWA domain-containing protein, partial [Pirellulaceae bacterium]
MGREHENRDFSDTRQPPGVPFTMEAMTMIHRKLTIFHLLLGTVAAGWSVPAPASGQTPVDPLPALRPLAANIILPQRRVFRTQSATSVEMRRVLASVDIQDLVATTTLRIELFNPGATRAEAELLVPVPDQAAIRGFAFQGSASEPTAELLPRDEARNLYESIVAQLRDPALLEFAGYNLIRSSVFPVEPGGTQTVQLTYEQVLTADGDRIDYFLPRSEALDYRVPWDLEVRLRTARRVATIYSPSHEIVIREIGRSGRTKVTLPETGATQPGPFRLSILFQREALTASLLAYPDPKIGGGYFMILAGVPKIPRVELEKAREPIELTLVLDRSGSMRGEKIEQVREAALQIVAGLREGDHFNLVTYNEAVDLFRDRPVRVTRRSRKSASA